MIFASPLLALSGLTQPDAAWSMKIGNEAHFTCLLSQVDPKNDNSNGKYKYLNRKSTIFVGIMFSKTEKPRYTVFDVDKLATSDFRYLYLDDQAIVFRTTDVADQGFEIFILPTEKERVWTAAVYDKKEKAKGSLYANFHTGNCLKYATFEELEASLKGTRTRSGEDQQK